MHFLKFEESCTSIVLIEVRESIDSTSRVLIEVQDSFAAIWEKESCTCINGNLEKESFKRRSSSREGVLKEKEFFKRRSPSREGVLQEKESCKRRSPSREGVLQEKESFKRRSPALLSTAMTPLRQFGALLMAIHQHISESKTLFRKCRAFWPKRRDDRISNRWGSDDKWNPTQIVIAMLMSSNCTWIAHELHTIHEIKGNV